VLSELGNVVCCCDVLEQHSPNDDQDEELFNAHNHLLKVEPPVIQIFEKAPRVNDLKYCVDENQ
jgi:hypothetical protein